MVRRLLTSFLAFCLVLSILSAPPVLAALKITPAAQKAYDAGYAAYRQWDLTTAIRYLNQALLIVPDWPQALNVKGSALNFQGHYREGTALIQRAIKLQPTYAYAYFNLGLSMELQKRYPEAITAYNQALKITPKDAWAYYGKACAYAGMYQVRGAITNLSKAIALNQACKTEARTEKDFNPIRQDPGFQKLIR